VRWPTFDKRKALVPSILIRASSFPVDLLITHYSVPVSFKPLVGEFCIVTCIYLFVVETMLTRFMRVVKDGKVQEKLQVHQTFVVDLDIKACIYEK
jgi:hypothetical protein